LASLEDGFYINQPDGATFSMVDEDIPYILVHFAHQVRKLRMTVEDANTGRNWGHRAYDLNYVGRNSTPTAFFAFAWDGICHPWKQGSCRARWRLRDQTGDVRKPWETIIILLTGKPGLHR
jgi:minor extracellular serine protease Vpr